MQKIKHILQTDLRRALKERNEIAIKTIRSLLSDLDNAGAVAVEAPEVMPMAGGIAGATDGLGSTEVPRKILSEMEIKQIIQREIDELLKTIELVEHHTQVDTQQLTEQVRILEGYLAQV